MNIVEPFIAIVQCFWQPLARQFNSFKMVEKNSETLRSKMEELNGQENDVKLEMNRAMVQFGKKPRSEVQIWMKNVEEVTKEVSTIEKELIEGKGKCMKGCFPNFNSRLKMGKLVEQKMKDVVELHRKGGFPNGLFVDALPERGKTLPTMTLMGRTAERTLKEILDCLVNEKIKKIGVHGMGGVGKTTIMMHINNQLNEAQIFDNVIWATVSKALNLEKLQHDIGKAIDLDLMDNEDATSRASKLFETLLRKKRFVLILDDLCCKFPLEKVGIPQPNDENGCKLVFTTRLMEVCRGMETQREIKVEVMSQEEAWDLFKDKVGAEVELHPEIETTAKLITKECGGLPLAIITVGRAMRRVINVRVWRNALEELKCSRADIEGMEEDVFARLKFSYNHLKNDRIRACLLYCALYPEDYKIEIEELIEYWMAEGLIDEVGDREKEIDKGHSILNELRDACVLESVGTKWVKMHDLVRDLAITITRENPCFIIKAGIGLKKIPLVEWMENVERVSLMENEINFLSDHSMGTKLCTLLLQRNPLPKIISYSFFERLHNLRVLDLSDTTIRLLPTSLSNLNNLHALLLRFCKIKKLPSLVKLKKLRVLDLSYTFITELPHDIEGLVNLRRLDLSYTEKLKVFPTEVIPKFSHLENLSMFKSRWRWSSNTGFKEVLDSTRLANLGISFKDLNSFLSYVRSQHWRMLRSYHLGIGLLSSFVPISEESYSVEIQGCKLISGGNSIILPENTRQLALQGCHDICRLSKLPCISNLSELKECYISRCNGMEYITMAEEDSLLGLERLVLRKLPKLMGLCDGIAKSYVFTRLKTLHIHSCNCLKNLFSLALLQQLGNLEEIEVWNSFSIEEIVGGEEEICEYDNITDATIILPRLRRLYLFSLPELKSICRRVFVCGSLDTIDVWDCLKLKKLPLSVDNLPLALKHIRGSKKWWDALDWDDNNAKTILQTFFKEDKEEGVVAVGGGGVDEEGDGEDDEKGYYDEEEDDDDDDDDEDTDDENFENAR